VTIVAIISVLIATGTWAAIRWTEESKRLDRTIADVLMSIPPADLYED
jgi:hypothetical protein